MSAAGPVSEGERLVSLAVVGGVPVGVLVVRDRDRSVGDAERMAIEHATTVLAMELARRQSLAQSDVRLRTRLVLDLVGGTDRATLVNRAEALGYDLGRPHRVVLVHAPDGAPQHAQIPAEADPRGVRSRPRPARCPVQPPGRHPGLADPPRAARNLTAPLS
jgi:hypothetical protein